MLDWFFRRPLVIHPVVYDLIYDGTKKVNSENELKSLVSEFVKNPDNQKKQLSIITQKRAVIKVSFNNQSKKWETFQVTEPRF